MNAYHTSLTVQALRDHHFDGHMYQNIVLENPEPVVMTSKQVTVRFQAVRYSEHGRVLSSTPMIYKATPYFPQCGGVLLADVREAFSI